MSTGGSLRFEVRRDELHGHGPPLALLHGFLGRTASWDAVLEKLPERGPVALAELPGHGPTPIVMDGAGFVAIADALVDALPFDEPTWLAGYSMGGRLALTMAVRRPDRVCGAVVVGANPGLSSAKERDARVRWDDEQADRLEHDGLARFVEAWEALPLFASQATLPAEVLAKQRAQRLDHTSAGLAWAMRALGLGRMPPVWDALHGTRLLAVAGGLDAKFAEHASAMARTSRNASVVIVPGVGHNVGLEAPSTLARWIDGAVTEGSARPISLHA